MSPMVIDPEDQKAIAKAAAGIRAGLLRRDERIRAARAKGATFRELAEAAGLTPAGVQRIVQRGRAEQ